MRLKKNNPWLFALILFTVICGAGIFLAACGGGGDDGDGGGDDDGSYASFGELEVPFGGVVISQFADQTLTLKNAGSVTLSLGQIDGPEAPFTIEEDLCSGTALGASGTCDIQVRFSPTEEGTYADAFVVPLSGSDTAFATVDLEGDGQLYNVSINQIQTDTCPTVRLIVAVTDENDNFVAGLTEDDFFLTEAGGEIVLSDSDVAQGTSENLSVVLALDTSGSVSGVITDVIAAAKEFINDMAVDDDAAVFKFAADGAEQVVGFTTATADGKEALAAAIDDGITYVGGNTALFDAVSDISDYIALNAAEGNRRAIVVITDGQDTASEIDLEAAVSAALGTETPVFTIGSGTENADVLQELANETGGQYYDAPEAEDIEAVYLKASALLSNQYEIEYASALEDVAVTVDLDVIDGDDLLGTDSREYEGCPAE